MLTVCWALPSMNAKVSFANIKPKPDVATVCQPHAI